MSERCGCCAGTGRQTPRQVVNRPGLPAVAYRVGTHASFLETMKASLSQGDRQALAGLTTREQSDPAIAWLDTWATLADVLTFYQERIANEGYLRTAVERRSILELARLIGYTLKPGVAASVFLAYSLENGHEVVIPAGSRAQSVPGPGELPQSFETAEDLRARSDWNVLKVRTARPQVLSPASKVLYLKGTTSNLKTGDRLLLVARTPDGASQLSDVPRIVEAVLEPAFDRTKVVLEDAELGKVEPGKPPSFDLIVNLTQQLTKAPSKVPPGASSLRPDRDVLFGEGADTVPRLLGSLHPGLGATLYGALAKAEVGGTPPVEVYALRTHAALFGHNAPRRPVIVGSDGRVFRGGADWPLHQIGVSGPKLDMRIAVEGMKQIAVDGAIGDRQFRGAGVLGRGEELSLGDMGSARVVAVHDAGFELIATFQPSSATVLVSWHEDEAHVSGVGPDGTLAVTAPTATVSGTVMSVEFSGVWQKVLREGPTEAGDSIALDAVYPRIVENSWVVIERPGETIAARATSVLERSRSDYGLSGRSTVIGLAFDDRQSWLREGDAFDVIRGTSVLAESEQLELADEPIGSDVSGRSIELAEMYGGLASGRWLIVSGERTDVPDTSGVHGSELVMLAAVTHDVSTVSGRPLAVRPDGDDERDAMLAGDRLHTFITLSTDLAYSYRRDTVRIHGNVVRATHGETRHEILGSGDAATRFLTFPLKHRLLTYVSAPTISGVDSTLEVRVNEVRWAETSRFAGLGPTDRRFAVRTDDEDHTTVVFGNGRNGARPPTGVENITARYRSGIGRPGNVRAGQISLLASRPLGVKEVVNSLPATGGADRETLDEARRDAPLGTLALDHLVSIQDYADFARTFGGVSKATSARLHHGRRALVHVTISGPDDSRLDETSDVFRNLSLAFHRFGDPSLPVRIGIRALRMLVVQARVRVAADYLWELVEPRIRSTMVDAFGFERRDLGQDVGASEILRVVQAVPGVGYVDLDLLSSIPEDFTQDDLAALAGPIRGVAHHRRIPARPARVDGGAIHPAELVVLSPLVPETLLLSEIE
jgi:hypothetical protein